MNSSKWRFTRKALPLSMVVIGASGLLAGPAFASAPLNINTVAGDNVAGSTGNGGPAVKAELNTPSGVAYGLGSLYIADSANNEVRKVVNPTTINTDTISVVAGTGSSGFSGDGGAATSAKLSAPTGVAVDSTGDIFIADTGNSRVREVVASTGKIKTVAGSGKCSSSLGNGGAATSASLCLPTGVALNSAGTSLYVADSGHAEVRVVNLNTGIISAYAGNGSIGYSGDGGAATSAKLGVPSGIAVDGLGNLYIADSLDTVVREVNTAGKISTFAGMAFKFGFAGDGGAATSAKLNAPTGVGVDSLNDVFISDTLNNRVREVTGGVITTAAGNGTRGFSGDKGPGPSAELNTPTGAAAIDGTTVFFSDTGNQVVRGLFTGPAPVLPQTDWAVLLPFGMIALIGGFFIVQRRRHSHKVAAATTA
jgi:NHL repeat